MIIIILQLKEIQDIKSQPTQQTIATNITLEMAKQGYVLKPIPRLNSLNQPNGIIDWTWTKEK